ncbi:delta-like protein 1 [Amphibalanus amphitrite]|uniref:delta-like protein 1 n=1 Tax=Amphibalanus amphitrite TaxID=1232801 RepID=UPI001C916B93|nr:delta-like protein 1 [Amphibalanus amphitrite]
MKQGVDLILRNSGGFPPVVTAVLVPQSLDIDGRLDVTLQLMQLLGPPAAHGPDVPRPTAPEALLPICAKDCDRDRGFCTRPNECRCRPGWRGTRCDQCVRLPGCRHGTCSGPLECRCRPGWAGFLCERAICRQNCSKQHGFCEQPGVCRCELGWHGDLCDTCLPYPGCVNGNCTQPWQCNCHSGWTGFLCDKPTEPCPAGNDPCKNGGTCEMVLQDGLPAPRCVCTTGFSGATCELQDPPLESPGVPSRSTWASR